MCATIFDSLRRPGGPAGIESWEISGWDGREQEVSVFIGPEGKVQHEVFLTDILAHEHNDKVAEGLAQELGMDADYLKRLASIVAFPTTPPVILSPDNLCLFLWMPTCLHYISSDWGATVDLATLREGGFWEYTTVASWK